MDVYAIAKILIFQQITTPRTPWQLPMGCLCYCKDTNFSANHNACWHSATPSLDVYAIAKILIFQQITTADGYNNDILEMFMLLQRY